MKDIIIKFLKENDCNNYNIKEYPNGGVKVTVEMEDYPYELCKKAEAKGFYAETFFYKLFIYDDKGRKEFEKRRFRLVTVAEMQAVTSKLIALGFGEYSVLCRIPFYVDDSDYSWDAYAFESSVINSNSIYFDLAEYSRQVMLPDNLLKLAEKVQPSKNVRVRGSGNVKTFNKILLDLIDKGFSEHYIFRTSFEDEDDKYEVFSLDEVIETTEECVYFSLKRI